MNQRLSVTHTVGKLWLKRVWSNELLRGDEGQDVAEYAMMMAVILVIVLSTAQLIASNAGSIFSSVASGIQ